MRKAVVVSAQAEADIDEASDHLAENAGRAVSNNWDRDVLKSFALIEAHPDIGAPRSKLGKSVRIWTVLPYLIVYEVGTDAVSILRVLHGKRKITRNLIRGGNQIASKLHP